MPWWRHSDLSLVTREGLVLHSFHLRVWIEPTRCFPTEPTGDKLHSLWAKICRPSASPPLLTLISDNWFIRLSKDGGQQTEMVSD
ncbi:hypothetical protein RRG08_022376 [Elysia crispata]|uniref:Uncharacterized protein n=1 Tax=Elysia crispata TaxID=231223 RepID=A0AAE0Z130_9GAST|nr:hypothetical protein RRG08_022376 [Elysia crispata]